MTDPSRSATIRGGGMSARIDADGAQLMTLDDDAAGPLLWDGDPQFWTGRSPILFPVIGCVAGNAYRLDGREYAMTKHGFARDNRFALDRVTADRARFTLTENARPGADYPFAFALSLTYALDEDGLSMTACIANRGDRPMPASFGFHPALRWPLPYGGEREDHAVVFADTEPDPIRRLNPDGLLLDERFATPVDGDTLTPRDAMFAEDALIFDALRSRRVRFGVPGRTRLEIGFDDFSALGIWTKPGAPFLCIEPWQGIADPVGFDGDIFAKPGIMAIAPDDTRTLTMTIRKLPA
ncbi:aldose 1-epimerase family protein [Croceicoccus sp. YJ47]|uniref:aldose 1-epimerase family protein n=1 Tax=Croceicoccus sp. YJ47 TaxID=2798724 RepID=UPI001920B4A0|nr:aldose 1-epimerase family protein [Croceicoccus sp. YJ47]QQN75355.1 aldose 1-epimerase family protein [Croceicoccus sp. YJ47]